MRRLLASLIVLASVATAHAYWQSRAQVSAGSVPFGLSFVTSAVQNTPTGGVCDFGTVSLGSADPTKQDVLIFSARFTTAATFTSATVGGVAQTVKQAANSASVADVEITATANSSGAAANITATYSANVARCNVSVYRLVGSTATVTGQGNDFTTAGATSSKTFTGTTGGGMVAGSVSGLTQDTTSTTTNMTTDLVTLQSVTLYMTGSNTSHAGSSTAYTFTYKAGGVNVGSSTVNAAAWASIAP